MPIIDYLILTPLDEEFKAFREAWPTPLEETRVSRIPFYRGVSTENGRQALIVASAMGDMGQALSGVFASEALRIWKPANVIQIGIAGSIVGVRLPLGDVLIPQEVLGYDVGEARDPEQPARSARANAPRVLFRFRPTGRQADFGLMNAARALCNDQRDYSNWREAAKTANAGEGDPTASRIPEVHIGSKEVLASGNFVMKSQNFAAQLKDQIHPGLRAVEMEAKGLFDAVRLAGQTSATLIVRGISDQAGPDKEGVDDATGGAFRRASVRAATIFVAHLIRRELRHSTPDNGSQPIELNTTSAQNESLVAREHNLTSHGGRSVCVAFDSLLNRVSGTPELRLNVRADVEPGADLQIVMKQTRGRWRQNFPESRSAIAGWTVERSYEPYVLSLAAVTTSPILNLTISAQSEFNVGDEKSLQFGARRRNT
jgi:nucleoside phosphorylase